MASNTWLSLSSIIIFTLVCCCFLSFGTSSVGPVSNREALSSFFRAFNGTKWLKNTNWNGDMPVCNWFGITCNESKQVIGVVLSSNNVEGRIEDLSYLNSIPTLLSIDLSSASSSKIKDTYNEFWGFASSLQFSLRNLTRLQDLYINQLYGLWGVDDGGIVGTLADFVNLPSSLKNLDISGHKLTGPIKPLSRAAWKASIEYFRLGQTPTAVSGDLSDLDLPKWTSLVDFTLSGYENFAVPTIQIVTGDIKIFTQVPKLMRLDVSRSLVSGNIASLLSLTNLEYLILSYTSITGTLANVAKFRKLRQFSFNGKEKPFGGQLKDLAPLQNSLIRLQVNRSNVTGDLADLSFFTKLKYISLRDTWITGDLLSLRQLSKLELLVASRRFNKNFPKITGNINILSSFESLKQVALGGNDLTGDLESATNFTRKSMLIDLGLPKNSGISGNLSSKFLKHHALLETLDVGDNSLEGTIPDDFDSTPNLRHLILHSNNFRGPIPPSIGRLQVLQDLTLHDNYLVGSVPPLRVGNIKDTLPYLSITLSTNRLSCVIPPATIVPGGDFNSIVVLGNLFSGPLPDWIKPEESQATSLYLPAPGSVPNWLNISLRFVFGFFFLCVIVLIINEGQSWLDTATSLKQYEEEACHDVPAFVVTASILCCFLALLFLLPVYIAGATFYDCGDSIMIPSMAYLNEVWATWSIAVFYVLYSFVLLLCLFWYIKLFCDIEVKNTVESSSTRLSTVRALSAFLLLFLFMFLFAIPTFIYGICLSTPRNNIMSRGVSVDIIMSVVMGPLMVITSSFFIPLSAKFLGVLYSGHRPADVSVGAWDRIVERRVVTFIGIMLMFNLVIIPLAAGVIFSDGCFGGFVILWDSCRGDYFRALTLRYLSDDMELASFDSICGLQTSLTRYCTRRLITMWFPVILSQYITSSFLGPAIAIVRASDKFAPIRQRCLDWLHFDIGINNRRQNYRQESVVMLAELVQLISFGFFAPVLMPVGCISFIVNGTTRYLLNCKIANKAVIHRLPFTYIVFSCPLLLSTLTGLAFYEESWAGQELVWSVSGVSIVTTVVLMIGVAFGRIRGSKRLRRLGTANLLKQKFKMTKTLNRFKFSSNGSTSEIKVAENQVHSASLKFRTAVFMTRASVQTFVLVASALCYLCGKFCSKGASKSCETSNVDVDLEVVANGVKDDLTAQSSTLDSGTGTAPATKVDNPLFASVAAAMPLSADASGISDDDHSNEAASNNENSNNNNEEKNNHSTNVASHNRNTNDLIMTTGLSLPTPTASNGEMWSNEWGVKPKLELAPCVLLDEDLEQ